MGVRLRVSQEKRKEEARTSVGIRCKSVLLETFQDTGLSTEQIKRAIEKLPL